VEAALRDRWYGQLVEPVLPTVESAVSKLGADAFEAWDVPRAGLGGAVVVHVSRGFGTRRWQEGSRLAVMAVEAYNQRVHLGSPTRAARSAWLERDVSRLRRVWKGLVRRDAALVGRVVDRILGGPADLGDDSLPEGVLFLRGAVAAGVLAGDVPDDTHAFLDRYVTWLGLAWEAAQGTLDAEGWHGALRAVGLPTRRERPADATEEALREAWRALSSLPGGDSVERLGAVLDRVPRERFGHRDPVSWDPLLAPAPQPTGATPVVSMTPLTRFRTVWGSAIEHELGAMMETESRVLGRAVAYLREQGGKRVRPLLTLASSAACGGDPRRALPAGAAVEWLHQASLVFDDVVDEARLRRGGPTLHHATSAPFAIGVGTYLLARIHRRLRGMHPAIRDRVVEAATALVEGQRSELEHTGDFGLGLTGYYRVIEAKTARLFACAAAVGAISVDAPATACRAAHLFGREAGLAFQIVDDLLDYCGEEAKLGKRPGTDLRAGKITMPVLLLREQLGARERRRLARALRPGEVPHDALAGELAWIRERMFAVGVDRSCRERATRHLGLAREALAGLPEEDGRGLLEALALRFVERTR